jgi:16S rRNA (guanine966-N2)-methyltransferase
MPHKPRRTVRESHSTPIAASVRIVGGELRGRKIEYAADPRTRPMKDRVREAVFNLLGEVSGMVAIDLFAGTGALGFEALSRGARAAVFFEQHFPTAELIRRQAAVFGVAGRCEIIAGDTFARFRRTVAMPDSVGDLRWVVFCSPPYEFYSTRSDDMLHLLGQLWGAAPPQSVFMVEADDRFDFSLLPGPDSWDIRTYPPARIGLSWKR